MDRREFLKHAASAGLVAPGHAIGAARPAGPVVNDVSTLNPVTVAAENRPRTTEEVRAALRNRPGGVSIGGGRFSMGGQIAAPDSLHLDMRAMNQVVTFEPGQKVIRVQAGMTWRDLQDVIDPHDLSIRIMQSYANFTVGGSVSVNCHGRYVGRGPLINSVRAVQLVTASGDVLELTRSGESELFGAVFGGYGGLGVLTEIELDLDRNKRLERVVKEVSLEDYPDYFRAQIAAPGRVLLHNANLLPPDSARVRAISWLVSEKPLTVEDRLVPRDLDYSRLQNVIWAVTELPGGHRLREGMERELLEAEAVVWRNHEASLDTASLEPRTRAFSTYLLQEYFIPVDKCVPFARAMTRILGAQDVEAVNISVRHSPPDATSLLTWAPAEVFSFVLYYKQSSTRRASRKAAIWTRELIDAALAQGGRYYLPYRLHATRRQFQKAYPEFPRFAALKARIDPLDRFRNLLLNKYLDLGGE